ncbi:MAG: I78 family peptidase inhibitor [Sphingobium sp.]
MGATSLFTVSGCAATSADTDAASTPPSMEGACKNDDLQQFIGQKATAELGARMLEISGARTLRWGGPNTAMTMDFRPDRLTVSYDYDMVIERASCG